MEETVPQASCSQVGEAPEERSLDNLEVPTGEFDTCHLNNGSGVARREAISRGVYRWCATDEMVRSGQEEGLSCRKRFNRQSRKSPTPKGFTSGIFGPTEAESARADFQHGQSFVFVVLVETSTPCISSRQCHRQAWFWHQCPHPSAESSSSCR